MPSRVTGFTTVYTNSQGGSGFTCTSLLHQQSVVTPEEVSLMCSDSKAQLSLESLSRAHADVYAREVIDADAKRLGISSSALAKLLLRAYAASSEAQRARMLGLVLAAGSPARRRGRGLPTTDREVDADALRAAREDFVVSGLVARWPALAVLDAAGRGLAVENLLACRAIRRDDMSPASPGYYGQTAEQIRNNTREALADAIGDFVERGGAFADANVFLASL